MNTTTENNKLIAEFMGYVHHPNISADCYIRKSDRNTLRLNEVKYITSWDWLMPVVEKIESFNYDFQILGGKWVIIKDVDPDRNGSEEILEISEATKLLTVYVACVEFIKWHNEQNPN